MPFATKDLLSINTIRCLASDVVQKAKSGHPGAPMGCAPMAHVLFSRFLKINPTNYKWIGRDRFVLSNGHACALQYILLHLLGAGLSMEDLKAFRQLNSKTPGHPESHLTEGIEVTTGPLGQGFANAVGLAIAEAHLAATFNRPSFPLVDNFTYAITGDGCLQEGIASEAASLAGHLQLGRLIVLYDDNHITIDGETELSFTEDVTKRFEAYGWHTLVVEDGDNNLEGIEQAILKAKAETGKPSLIKIRTTIGFGSTKQGAESVHGAPLGAEDVAQVKTKFGFDPSQAFVVPDEVYAQYAQVRARGQAAEQEWNKLFARYAEAYPQLAAELKRRLNGELPRGWEKALPQYTSADPELSTRKLSENVLNKIADVLPELIGGSADLTGSNFTRWKTAVDFQPENTKLGNYAGRYLRFGVREHGMMGICNGLAAYGALIPFGASFLNFISYALGAVRLSALSSLRVISIMTHDSIGLGEDGPTHQPIETMATLRATPNLVTLRPADGNEVSGAYLAAITNFHRPCVISLSRQNAPQLANSSIEKTLKGGYVVHDEAGAQVALVSSGTEVAICLDAAKVLQSCGIKARVVSMPSMELFDEQPQAYRDSVLNTGIPVVSVEPYSTFGWSKYAHVSIGMTTFGACGPYKEVYRHFGLYPEAIAEKVQKVVAHYAKEPVPKLDQMIL